jgi:hypothetical protein
MILEQVAGTPLSQVLDQGGRDGAALAGLGAEVGRAAAAIGAVTFGGPGFFTDEKLTAHLDQPWSRHRDRTRPRAHQRAAMPQRARHTSFT